MHQPASMVLKSGSLSHFRSGRYSIVSQLTVERGTYRNLAGTVLVPSRRHKIAVWRYIRHCICMIQLYEICAAVYSVLYYVQLKHIVQLSC